MLREESGLSGEEKRHDSDAGKEQNSRNNSSQKKLLLSLINCETTSLEGKGGEKTYSSLLLRLGKEEFPSFWR